MCPVHPYHVSYYVVRKLKLFNEWSDGELESVTLHDNICLIGKFMQYVPNFLEQGLRKSFLLQRFPA